MRLLHRLRRHRAVIELIEAAAIIDLVLRPQRLDQLDLFAEAAHAAFLGHLELAVVMLPPKPDTEDRPPVADVIERRPLMRHHQRAVDRQHHHRCTDADPAGDRGRIGQHHDRIEAGYMVKRIFRHPQIAEPQRLRALRDRVHRPHVDRIGRTMRQRHAERDLVLQGHAVLPPCVIPAKAGIPGRTRTFTRETSDYTSQRQPSRIVPRRAGGSCRVRGVGAVGQSPVLVPAKLEKARDPNLRLLIGECWLDQPSLRADHGDHDG